MRQSDVNVGVLAAAYLRIIIDVRCAYASADLAMRVKHPHFLRGLRIFRMPPPLRTLAKRRFVPNADLFQTQVCSKRRFDPDADGREPFRLHSTHLPQARHTHTSPPRASREPLPNAQTSPWARLLRTGSAPPIATQRMGPLRENRSRGGR